MKGLTNLLSELNINNKMIDSSCCGMAGSFGYDSKTYDCLLYTSPSPRDAS